MAGMAPERGAGGGGKAGLGYRRLIGPLLVPTRVMDGIFLVLPEQLMAVGARFVVARVDGVAMGCGGVALFEG